MDNALYRPEPILRHRDRRVDRDTPPRRAAERLIDGEVLLVSDRYSTGAEIIAQLEALLGSRAGDAYPARRAAERRVRTAALRLLAPIVDHRVALEGAGAIGFLPELYPDHRSFALPFVQVQELHGAWRRYRDGVNLTVLGYKVHPYFGTYAPVRTEHLELFGTWLSQYEGPRERAIDVGTGCGVLALMLCKAGFQRVLATDDNPNAVESVERERERLVMPIDARCCDLLGHGSRPVELVVFNPPWMQGAVEGAIDGALYFEDPALFERFFTQAHERNAPDGRVVLLFSNVMQLVQPDVQHPILAELERGRFRLVQKLQRKAKATPGRDGRRRKTREKVEVWELARL